MGCISCYKREAEVLLVNQYLPIGDTKSYAKEENRVDQLLQQLKKWENHITNPFKFYKKNMGFELKRIGWIVLLRINCCLRSRYMRIGCFGSVD